MKVLIIGGGPAGMMAAIRASELKNNVTLIEQNSTLGKKLLLTGKGRCNITNACKMDDFFIRFSKNGQFLRDSFKALSNKDLIDFFQRKGLRLKTERQERVFPVTDNSTSVLNVLKEALYKNSVSVIYRSTLKSIKVDKHKAISAVFSNGRVVSFDKLILATGGISYPQTGSDGAVLKLISNLGHNIVRLRPGLVSLITKEDFPKMLEGLTLKNIRLKFFNKKKKLQSDIGELLFTSNGISGPLVFTLSGKVDDWLVKDKDLFVDIDLKPALSEDQLDKRLLREVAAHPKSQIKSILATLLPERLIALFLELSKISDETKASQLLQIERKKIIALLKGFTLHIKRTAGMDRAMITRGGVSLKEIDPRSMQSRLIENLFFCGEMIDVDADTGGFNLQAAFSTGYVAGSN